MKIYCSCGKLVVEGNIVERINLRGKSRKAFDILEKPNGTILKNNSNNPKNWFGKCSDCQKEDKK